jgi:hypothetical protein
MRYLSALIFVTLLPACKPKVICDPAPPIRFQNFGFIVRDSNGLNLFGLSAANRLDTAHIKVTQPCSNISGRVKLDEDSVLSFDVELCHNVLVQWRETDTDTITYSVSTGPDGCGGRLTNIDGNSIRINGRAPMQEDNPRGGHVLVIRK